MIKIRISVLVLLLMAGQVLFGQADLMIQGASPDLYLTHRVVPKETWYSIGRMYNLSPKEIAAYNKTSMDRPLGIDQAVRIPLTSNFSQTLSKSSDEVLIPLYHIIKEKEWMYRISVNHNKVPIENLEKWNNVSRDQAKAGTKLIVGFLKVKESQSPLAANGYASPQTAERDVARQPTPEPAVKKDAPVLKDNSPIPRETPKTEAARESGTPAAANFRGGYFRAQYDATGQSANGVSGIFRSTSGWKDGKYYALMNNVPVGTIVKVNFPSTNKSVYAKVLGQLPDMRESQGLTIRISEAAASELGAGNTKFTVDVAY